VSVRLQESSEPEGSGGAGDSGGDSDVRREGGVDAAAGDAWRTRMDRMTGLRPPARHARRPSESTSESVCLSVRVNVADRKTNAPRMDHGMDWTTGRRSVSLSVLCPDVVDNRDNIWCVDNRPAGVLSAGAGSQVCG
jgi:hypothetical protein